MASKDLVDTIIAEAGGEGRDGIIAATWAIAQRAAARGQTMDQVIKSGFDGYSNPGSGSRRAQQNQQLRNQVQQIIAGVQDRSIPNPVPGADHFLSGDAMPSWARNMDPVATIGGHRFYASGQVPQSARGIPLPPREVGSVGTLLDTVPPRPIAPATPTPLPSMLAAQRNLQPVSTNMDSFYQGILPQQNLTQGNAITRSVQGAQSNQNQALANALQARVAASQRVTQPMPSNVRQSYAAQDAAPSRTVPYSQGTTIASIPTRPSVPASSNFAGQERAPGPAPYGAGTTIATVPTNPARLPPLPPSTTPSPRLVQTTIERAAAATRPEVAAALTARATPPIAAPAPAPTSAPHVPGPMDRIDTAMPTWDAFQAEFGRPRTTVAPPVAPPAIPSSRLANTDNERLVAGIYPMAPRLPPAVPDFGVRTALSVVPPAVANIPPLPRAMPARSVTGYPTMVAQRPAIAPQQPMRMANVPLPQRRPMNALPVALGLAPAPLRIVVQADPRRQQVAMVGPAPFSRGVLDRTAAAGFGSDSRSSYSSSTSISSI